MQLKRDPTNRVGVLHLAAVWAVALGILAGACDGDNRGGPSPPNPPSPPSPPSPRVAIESPSGATAGLVVTFRWHLENPEAGRTYSYEVLLDKGVNACDNVIEQAFPAQERTCLSVQLPSTTYADQRVEFGIRATDSQGRTFCSAGTAALTINPALPASPPCG